LFVGTLVEAVIFEEQGFIVVHLRRPRLLRGGILVDLQRNQQFYFAHRSFSGEIGQRKRARCLGRKHNQQPFTGSRFTEPVNGYHNLNGVVGESNDPKEP